MQLQTTVQLPTYPFEINHQHKITCIGSCFADNMGQKFRDNKFDTLINPFGVLYNPLSVFNCIDNLTRQDYDEDQLIYHDGLWHSFSHHGRFSNKNKETLLQEINDTLIEGHQHLKESDYLFITLGTAQIFEYHDKVVSNCHKIPASQFKRRRLTVEEIVKKTRPIISQLKTINPALTIIFTVSPVRYIKDGLNENSLSKATLHLATEEITRHTDNAYYLPAYEIINDELRDYRYFAEDMTHPSPLAIEYLWDKLSKQLFTPATQNINKQVLKLVQASQHRPFNINPEAHKKFLSNMLKKASDLQKQHPELNLEKEINYFSK